ncbi:MAG: phage minor capsid protein, partial [Candidatus Fonsibacter sp.]
MDGDSSYYFCSIVRFTVQTTNNRPLFIPVVEQGQNTRNKTIYRVSLKYAYKGKHLLKTTVPIQYYPEDSTAPVPEPPINKQDLTSNYYYVHNYNHLMGMINLALETAFSLLIVDLLRLDNNTPLDTTVSPLLDFDPHKNKIILYADFFAYDEVYTGITGTTPVEIYFNERLYDLCIGLPASRVSKTGDLNY